MFTKAIRVATVIDDELIERKSISLVNANAVMIPDEYVVMQSIIDRAREIEVERICTDLGIDTEGENSFMRSLMYRKAHPLTVHQIQAVLQAIREEAK